MPWIEPEDVTQDILIFGVRPRKIRDRLAIHDRRGAADPPTGSGGASVENCRSARELPMRQENGKQQRGQQSEDHNREVVD